MTTIDSKRCARLVADIQSLSQVEVEEIFRIVHESSCDYTRNNNGIFVNLAWLPGDTIEKLEKYVKFCNQSRKELTKYESLCDVLNHKLHETSDQKSDQTSTRTSKKALHAQHNKMVDKNCTGIAENGSNQDDATSGDIESSNTSKVSSSLRYYLLKKRYAKQQQLPSTAISHLSKDEYIIVC